MQVLVWVRGDIDPCLLWPWHARYRQVPPGGVLTLTVHDDQDLVAALLVVSTACQVRRVQWLGRGPRPGTGPAGIGGGDDVTPAG